MTILDVKAAEVSVIYAVYQFLPEVIIFSQSEDEHVMENL